jgi:iron complex transport system substrate-binding protein
MADMSDGAGQPGARISRRQLIGGAIAAAVVAGCGGDDAGTASTAGTAASTPAPSSSAAATTSTAVATTAATTSAPAPAGTATIDTPAGAFEIPLDPQRVVAIEPRLDVEIAVALGLPLVAIGGNNAAMSGTLVAPWVPIGADVPLLGGTDENIEAIAAMQPDLIVCNTGSGALDQLGQIAPLLAQEWDRPWRVMLEQAGAWMQRTDAVAAALAEFDETVADVAGRHAGVLATAALAVVQPGQDGTFRTEGMPSSLIHLQALAALGGSVLPFAQEQDWSQGVSDERIAELAGADGLLVLVPPGQEGAIDAAPFWSDLPAVAGGRYRYADARVNFGLVYTALECARIWDDLLGKL